MLMPVPSRIIYTFIGITLPIGSFWADYNETHIFSAFIDPQLVTPNSFPHGIALQVYIEAAYLALTAVAGWLALRSGARWVARQPARSTSFSDAL